MVNKNTRNQVGVKIFRVNKRWLIFFFFFSGALLTNKAKNTNSKTPKNKTKISGKRLISGNIIKFLLLLNIQKLGFLI